MIRICSSLATPRGLSVGMVYASRLASCTVWCAVWYPPVNILRLRARWLSWVLIVGKWPWDESHVGCIQQQQLPWSILFVMRFVSFSAVTTKVSECTAWILFSFNVPIDTIIIPLENRWLFCADLLFRVWDDGDCLGLLTCMYVWMMAWSKKGGRTEATWTS